MRDGGRESLPTRATTVTRANLSRADKAKLTNDPRRAAILGLTAPVVWLGLDTSVAAFGYCALSQRRGEKPVVLEVGTWETEKDANASGKFADSARRIDYLAAQFCDLVLRTKPDVAFVEGLAYVKGCGFIAAAQMGRIRGAVEGVCKALTLPLFEFSAQKVKLYACGARNASKQEVASRMRALYNGAIPLGAELDENATDALAVAHLGAASEQVAWHLTQRPT